MTVNDLSFGSITIDGETYDKDVIIDNGSVKKRKKAESKKYREMFGHTPLSSDENIPWKCKYLIIGAGHSSSLPVMDEVYNIATRKGVEMAIMSTPEAIKHINNPHTNFVLHLTC
ncbi:MAG: MTH938/NDUFAF3 family protein [Bacteroidales bacterium]